MEVICLQCGQEFDLMPTLERRARWASRQRARGRAMPDVLLHPPERPRCARCVLRSMMFSMASDPGQRRGRISAIALSFMITALLAAMTVPALWVLLQRGLE